MKSDLWKTFERLHLKTRKSIQAQYEPLGPGASLEEEVMAMAAALGAEDPYLAVLYPDWLDAILENRTPDWMESFTDGPDFL